MTTYLDEAGILRLYKITRLKLVAVFKSGNIKRRGLELPSERDARLHTELTEIIKEHETDSFRLLMENVVPESNEQERETP